MGPHPPANGIAAKFKAANAAHATSTRYLRSMEAVSDVPDRLDHVLAELRPQAPDADIDGVRPWLERVAPHVAEQLLARAHLVAMADEMLEQQELAGRESHRALTDVGRPVAEIEHEPAHA